MFVVIMAGGSGTRFWPASRERWPKQFLAVGEGDTLFEQTLSRIRSLVEDDHIYVVVNKLHEATTRNLLGDCKAHVLVEPSGRSTAACIGLSAVHLMARNPDEPMLVLPSDHFISNDAAFRLTLRLAAEVASVPGRIVTLGAAPARPETGYGYIELSDEELDARPAQDNILESGIGKVYRVARFIEKPDQATAASYAADGKHLWNCGIFGFTARTLMSEIQRTMPGLSTALMEAARVIGSRDFDARLEELYEPLDSISIDHGVMEKTAAPIYVIRADFGWSDVGSWQAVYELQAPRADSDRNVFIGEAIAVDARGNLVMNQGSRLVALLGVDDLVIVDTPDAILVASRKRSQEVRRLVESLKLRGLNKLT